MVGGFTPTPFGTVTPYTPTMPEILITLGVYAIGALTLTLLWKIAIDVKKEAGTFALVAD
jgi:molybdopterin-containing oxidoreductase family membrane subunit